MNTNYVRTSGLVRMAENVGWSKNVLVHQVENKSCEKSLVGQNNFEQALAPELRDQAKLAVRDEYTFHFLERGEQHSERGLERGLIGRVEELLQSIGGVFMSALGRQVREDDEAPSIGIILCKEKSRTIVEYALHDARKPIGVATYRMVSQLPDNLKDQLPAPGEIARLLEKIK